MISIEPKIVIIILNWNGKEDTLACLKSVEQLSYRNFETIVVDNGSTDNSISCIRKEFPSIHLIAAGENLGFAEGNNVGIRYAKDLLPEFIFLLNNDTIVASDILEAFVTTHHSHPEFGILGAKILLFNQRDTIDHLGGKWNQKKGLFDLIGLRQKENEEQWQKPQELDYVCGAGIMIKSSVIEAIGDLEARFFLIWEEADFCFRARKAGFKSLSCPQAKLWHKVSASFTGGKPHSTYFWWRNRLLWVERNCSPQERAGLYLRVFIPRIIAMIKIHLLKRAQLFFIQQFNPKVDVKEKKQKLAQSRAALHGIRDYLFKKFGNGPSWIYKKH